MNNASQWVLVKQIAEVTVYSENTARHKVENGTWVGNSIMMFDVHESRECYRQGGAA
ncbi:MAG: hypothetical protein Q7K57_17805 [Burkholderiaceae bacterium]|nr:hypothetical protein [Burkholderiaceae bacterium]